MSELMTPIPFRQLMTWITTEYAGEGSVFGVHRPDVYKRQEITFAGTLEETETERDFFRFLIREGIPVRVESNR